MLGNLLRPWLLARLVTSGTGAVLAVVVVVLAVRLLRAPALARSSEGQLLLDRRAELIGTLTAVAAWCAIGSLAVAVVGADRMHGSLRGAMCAYGVLEATSYGFRSLFVALAAALGASAWLALHRAGLALKRPVLTQLELFCAAALAPLFAADFVLSTAHALALDFREVASCCSSGLEATREVLGHDGGPRMAFVASFFGFGALALIAAIVQLRKSSDHGARAVALFSALSLVAAPLAIVTWVAPHAYGTPNHLCPFCLLHGDEALGIGWLLYVALFVAVSRGLAVGITRFVRRAATDPEANAEVLDVLGARLARGAAIAWLVALVLAAAPWALFTMQSGASLF